MTIMMTRSNRQFTSEIAAGWSPNTIVASTHLKGFGTLPHQLSHKLIAPILSNRVWRGSDHMYSEGNF